MKKIHQAGPWIGRHEERVVLDALRNGWYERPYDYVETFQREFAAYHGRKHGIMTPNCTTAIHLLLTCLGVKEGDEVIVPECTWIATVAPVVYLRATPVFCDIDPVNWCMDPDSMERCITKRTRAIIPVGLYGNMPEMRRLTAIARRRRVHLIEDAAESLGSTYRGRKSGSFGVGSVFSFHRTKTLTTGEGGMLLVDDGKLYEACMMWRDHGRKPGGAMYVNDAVTYKYMPFNLQAALGYAQFQRLGELVGKKRWMFERYKKGLAGVPDIQFNAEPPGGQNAVWDTTLVIGKRYGLTKEDLIARLAKNHIPVRPFFYPLSSLPAFAGMERKYRSRNVVAYDLSRRGISLPCALNLTAGQIDHICRGIKKVLRDRRPA